MSFPFVNITLQQGKGDCVIAALAMLLNRPYLDVFAAAVPYRIPHHTGMMSDAILATAETLGAPLVLRRAWDLDSDCGLLVIEKVKRTRKDFPQHVVLLKWGLLFDSDGTVWEPDDYFRLQGFRPVSMFVEKK